MLENNATSHDQFWQKWRANQKRLLTYCLRWTKGDRDLSEDILSEAMLHGYGKFTQQHGKIANIDAWIFALTLNTFIQHQRQNKRYYTFLLEYHHDNAAFVVEKEKPDNIVNRSQFNKYLDEVIERLSPPLKLAVHLFLLGHNYSFISRSLNISEVTARKRISLAKDKMRNYLQNLPIH